MQDIVPRKTIREIQKDDTRGVRTQKMEPQVEVKQASSYNPEPQVITKMPAVKKNPWGRRIFAAVFLFVSIGFALCTYVFNNATVVIKPLTETITASTTDLQIPSGAYMIESIVKKDQRDVTASGTKVVSTKATGTIMLYNTFSTTPQTLVANTRLSSAQGKVYRLSNQAKIPGYTTVSGKVVPGSVQAAITADEAGPSYNAESLDLSIVAYAGTTKGEKIYARTKSAISGGASGTVPVLNNADVAKTVNDLSVSLVALTKVELSSRTKNGYISATGLENIATSSEVSGTTVRVTITAQKAYISKQNLVDQLIALSNNPKLKVGMFDIANQNLSLSTKNISMTGQTNPLVVTLSGTAIVKAQVDQAKIKQKLAEQNKDAFVSLMQAFPQFKEASYSFSPFWLQTFPKEKNITISVE